MTRKLRSGVLSLGYMDGKRVIWRSDQGKPVLVATFERDQDAELFFTAVRVALGKAEGLT